MNNEPKQPGEAKELTDRELEGIVGGCEAPAYTPLIVVAQSGYVLGKGIREAEDGRC